MNTLDKSKFQEFLNCIHPEETGVKDAKKLVLSKYPAQFAEWLEL